MSDINRDHLNALLRNDLGTFLVKVFQTLNPGQRFEPNWHLDAIVYELGEIAGKRNRRLIVNIPPRSLKTIIISVAFPAWLLGRHPTVRIACVSYSRELATDIHNKFRQVVASQWYREAFGAPKVTKDNESEWINHRNGGRLALGVGGSFTGRGADLVIIDDPLNAAEAQSEAVRKAVNDYFGDTLLSRPDRPGDDAIVVVAQRLHEEDICGYLLQQGGWRHLRLPAISDADAEIRIGRNATRLFREGELLHAARLSKEVLEERRAYMSAVAWSAQYLQQPIPMEGNLIRREWLKTYKELPERTPGRMIVQSWDVASAIGDKNDWSVCTTWMIDKRTYYLVDVWRKRREFPKLRKDVAKLAQHHGARVILIEKSGPGLQLIQELRANPVQGIPLPIAILPEADKKVRMEAQSSRFEAGQVLIPEQAPWMADFQAELLGFPGTRHDDQVDSVSQFLNWAEARHRNRGTVSKFGPRLIPAYRG